MTDEPWSTLSPRERDVVALVGQGYRTKQIAAKLNMQYRTVQVHVAAIAFKLKLDTNRDARVLIGQWWDRRTRDAA